MNSKNISVYDYLASSLHTVCAFLVLFNRKVAFGKYPDPSVFKTIFLDMTDKPLASILCVLCSVHCAEIWSDDCSYSCRFSLLTQNVCLWQLCLSFRFIRLNRHESKNISGYDLQAFSLHTVCAVQCAPCRTLVG